MQVHELFILLLLIELGTQQTPITTTPSTLFFKFSNDNTKNITNTNFFSTLNNNNVNNGFTSLFETFFPNPGTQSTPFTNTGTTSFSNPFGTALQTFGTGFGIGTETFGTQTFGTGAQTFGNGNFLPTFATGTNFGSAFGTGAPQVFSYPATNFVGSFSTQPTTFGVPATNPALGFVAGGGGFGPGLLGATSFGAGAGGFFPSGLNPWAMLGAGALPPGLLGVAAAQAKAAGSVLLTSKNSGITTDLNNAGDSHSFALAANIGRSSAKIFPTGLTFDLEILVEGFEGKALVVFTEAGPGSSGCSASSLGNILTGDADPFKRQSGSAGDAVVASLMIEPGRQTAVHVDNLGRGYLDFAALQGRGVAVVTSTRIDFSGHLIIDGQVLACGGLVYSKTPCRLQLATPQLTNPSDFAPLQDNSPTNEITSPKQISPPPSTVQIDTDPTPISPPPSSSKPYFEVPPPANTHPAPMAPSTNPTVTYPPVQAFPLTGSYPSDPSSPAGGYPLDPSPPTGSYPTGPSPTSGGYPSDPSPPTGSYPSNFPPASGGYPSDPSPPTGSYPSDPSPPTGSYPSNFPPASGGYPFYFSPPAGSYKTELSPPTGSYVIEPLIPSSAYPTIKLPPSSDYSSSPAEPVIPPGSYATEPSPPTGSYPIDPLLPPVTYPAHPVKYPIELVYPKTTQPSASYPAQPPPPSPTLFLVTPPPPITYPATAPPPTAEFHPNALPTSGSYTPPQQSYPTQHTGNYQNPYPVHFKPNYWDRSGNGDDGNDDRYKVLHNSLIQLRRMLSLRRGHD